MANQKQLAEAHRSASRLHHGMGEDIRRFREDAGLTRRQLAGLAGIDHTYLGRIEDAKSRSSIDTYAKLAAALGSDLNVRLSSIWGWGDPYQMESVPQSTLVVPTALHTLPSTCAAVSGARITLNHVDPSSAYTLPCASTPLSPTVRTNRSTPLPDGL
jgi:transcriptional regulator with XRE-family HTH domain